LKTEIAKHQKAVMTTDADKLEERTAEILGQIQASVAEYVRTMNESAALRRREADEAHRQQDKAHSALQALERRSQQLVNTTSELAERVGKDWLCLVERGIKDVAVAQARAAAETAFLQFETRATSLTASLDLAIARVGEIAKVNDRIQRAIAWKTCAVAGIWMIACAIVMRILIS
jgi:hypothetical protein